MTDRNSVPAPVPYELGLAGAVAALGSRALTPSALVDSCLQRVRALNPIVNAFVWVDELGAQQAAQAADARRANGHPLSEFDGIPVAIKDNLDVLAMPTSNGIQRGAPAIADAAIVAQLRRAGAIVLGKLNMHEAALGTTTENPHFGTTRNPLALGRSAGGSSGGSSAAVAAYMCPLAIGSDTMGSVRLPAASCGIFGWKPSHGVLSNDGMHLLDPVLDTPGPLVREAQDVELAMRLCGLAVSSADNTPLQFNTIEQLPLVSSNPDISAHAQQILAELNAVSIGIADFAPSPVRRAALVGIEARLASNWSARDRANASPALQQFLAFGDALSDAQVLAAAKVVEQTRERGRLALQAADVVVTLATPVPPTKLGAELVARHADYLLLANVTGAAAVTVPVGHDRDGLPIALQLLVAPGRDHRLVEAIRALEQRGLLQQLCTGRLDPDLVET